MLKPALDATIPFSAHAGLSEAEMKGIVATRRHVPIHVDQILHAADFCAEDNLIATQSVFFRQLGGVQRAYHHGFHGHVASVFRLGRAGIFVHHAREQLLIERSPVDADAHWFLILDGNFDHDAEVVVVLAAHAYVARVDAVLGQCARALRIFLQQQMAVVMKVADDGHVDPTALEQIHNLGDGFGGVIVVYGNADQFRSSARQSFHLFHGP